MKYGEMFMKCLDTIRHAVVEDYRPNEKMYVDDLEDKPGIRLWFDNGDSAIYYPEIKDGDANADVES